MAALHDALDRFEHATDFARFPRQDDRWRAFGRCVPPSEQQAWSAYRELMAWTGSLATSRDAFGLIHGDFTLMNFRVDRGELCLFDFDASCAHFRAYEIATFLHVFGPLPAEPRRRVYDLVLDGYASARPLGAELVAQIPLFARMRLLDSFLVFAQEWGFDQLSPEQHAYFELRRRLLAGPPVWPSG
jgi:Ser/Thr protein kinase RdoA (MazF antagonist)